MARRSTPFAIFATQRTGSSWVAGMIGSHPAIGIYGELFEPRGQGYPGWGGADIPYYAAYVRERTSHANRFTRARLAFSYLRELYSPKPGLEAIGFKLMYSNARDEPAVLPYMWTHRVRVVHLVRSNLLDILVSADTARARRRFHSTEDGVLAPVSVTLDPATLVARLSGLERQVRIMRRMLAGTRLRTIEVSYEDLVADAHRFEPVMRFLGVSDPAGGLRSDLRKLNVLGKREIIENYGEVEALLRDTRFGAFLGD